MMVRITNISKYNYNGEVIDFDVDGDDMFCAPYAMVHNCDPPYIVSKTSKRATKNLYQYEVNEQFHIELLNLVRDAKCQVILSGYDEPLYRELLPNFIVHQKEVPLAMGGGETKVKKVECLYCN